MHNAISIIEANHLGHFKYLPKQLGFCVDSVKGVTLINCGLNSSMFNIAYGVPQGLDMHQVVPLITQLFKGQPFAWWVPPTQCNGIAAKALEAAGFIVETAEHAMVCDLNNTPNLNQTTALNIKHVTNKLLLDDFMRVLEPYDANVKDVYGRATEAVLMGDEKLFVGYVGDVPVTIGILFVNANSAGIFSLITSEPFQGNGYGRDMMVNLMLIAKECHCRFVTLSASSDSGYRIYERLGFLKVGEFECYEHQGAV